jgi:hypothetical protein
MLYSKEFRFKPTLVSPEEKRTFLQNGVLQLPNADLSDGSMYYRALTTQAIPIVDLLVQLKDEGIERDNPVIAEYGSIRNGLLARGWNNDLKSAVNDLGRAAGLRVEFDQSTNDSFAMPERFRDSLSLLILSTSLQTRIEQRKPKTVEELDKIVKENSDYLQSLREGKSTTSTPQKKVSGVHTLRNYLPFRKKVAIELPVPASKPVDFRLHLEYESNKISSGLDYRNPTWTWSYHQLHHTLSLIPEPHNT